MEEKKRREGGREREECKRDREGGREREDGREREEEEGVKETCINFVYGEERSSR